jgi:general secretion pathway protein K
MATGRNRQLSRLYPRERGIALLTAVLVVAIGTIIATNLLWRSTLDQQRTASAIYGDQAMQYALGAEAWVADILRQDLEDSPDSDHFGEFWATEIEPLPIEGGFIIGAISDPQGLFNLNNLVTVEGEEDEVMLGQFERLLAIVGLDPVLAGGVVDWLDPDFELRFPNGAEDESYARSDPQYLAANSMMTSKSELMAIVGFDEEVYAAIEPFVTALPMGTDLNANTAPAEVLASLSEEIDLGLALSLIDERGDGPFANVETTFQGLVAEEMLPRIDGVTEHFELNGRVTIGDITLRISALMQRSNSGITRTIFRSFGIQ